MTGILLMCFNSQTYGRYAYNMAHSIRRYTNIPIHLLSDNASVEGLDKSVFNSHEIVEFEKNEHGKIDNCLAKIKLFERSPFEKTLYLDVDGMMINNPEDIIKRLEGFPFWTQPMGTGKRGDDSINYMWAKNELLYDRYDIPSENLFTTCQTSIIYFTKEAEGFFKKLGENYEKKLKPIEYREMWGRSKQHPDELYYSVTMAQFGINLYEWRPVFFPEKREEETKILDNYYVLSMYGGGNVKPYALKLYDRIMKDEILNPKKINHVFKAHELYKRKFIRIK
jgi:hypothetical protein